MAIGTPYPVGSQASSAASATLVITVTTSTSPGDAIVVGASVNSTSVTITGVTDSQGNPYTLLGSASVQFDGSMWVSLNTQTQLTGTDLGGTDTITVTYSSASAIWGKTAAAIGCSGIGSIAGTADVFASNSSAGSGTPNVASGALAQTDELLIAFATNGSGGGLMTWDAGWTQQVASFEAPPSRQWASMASQVVSSSSTVTASGEITSSAWSIMIASLIGGPSGGGGGSPGTYTFNSIGLDGSEMMSVLAINPANALNMVAGGDVEGMFYTANGGYTWRMIQQGLSGGFYGCASVQWSLFETNTVYACLGQEKGSGGFAVAHTGGLGGWTIRSSAPDFGANDKTFTPSSGYRGTDWRPAGHLVVQDAVNNYVFVGTLSSGVMRSNQSATTPGTSWTTLGSMSDSIHSLIQDPGNRNALYAGSATGLGVWYTANAQAAAGSVTWTENYGTGGPSNLYVSDLCIPGDGFIYCTAVSGTAANGGLFRAPLGSPSAAWTNLSGTAGSNYIDPGTAFAWTSVVGYVALSGATVLYVGCGHGASTPTTPGNGTYSRAVIQVTIPSGSSTPAYSHVTSQATINFNQIATGPSSSRWYWFTAGGSPGGDYIGGLSDPGIKLTLYQNPSTGKDELFACGGGGVYHTSNASDAPASIVWNVFNNGIALQEVYAWDVSPVNNNYFAQGSDDYSTATITEDGIGYGTASNSSFYWTPGGAGTTCQALCFDPVTANKVYFGFNTKYFVNTNGNIWSRNVTSTSGATQNTAYATHAGGAAPISMCVDYDSSGKQWWIVIAQGLGLVESYNGAAWTTVNTTVGTPDNAGNERAAYLMTHLPGSPYAYFFDKTTGVWRYHFSASGSTCTKLLSATGNATAGFCGIDPSDATSNTVYATDASKVYKITGAAGSSSAATLSFPPGNPASIAVGPTGTVYVYSDASGGSLWASSNGGSTWTQADDGSLAGQVAQPHEMRIGLTSGLIYIGTASNNSVYGQLNIASWALSSALHDSSSAAGSLTWSAALSSTLADSSATAGSLPPGGLASALAAGTATSASLAQSVALAGACASTAATAGSLAWLTPLDGTGTAATSATAGSLTWLTPIAGTAVASSLAAGSLTWLTPLAGSADATVAESATGSLAWLTPMAGSAVPVSAASGALTWAVVFAGTAPGLSFYSPAYGTTYPGPTYAAGVLTQVMAISGTAPALSVAAATLGRVWIFSGTASCASASAGSLFPIGQPVPALRSAQGASTSAASTLSVPAQPQVQEGDLILIWCAAGVS